MSNFFTLEHKQHSDNVKKYCIVNDIFISKCEDTSCRLYPCKFSNIHKTITDALKRDYGLTTIGARKIARRLLLTAYKPKSNNNIPFSSNNGSKRIKKVYDNYGVELK